MASPAIAIHNVSKVFSRQDGRERHVAVDGANLTVHEGEFFCLLGPSGCGKTTLLHLIAGFETPTDGVVEVFGEPVTDLTIRYVSQRSGYRFQIPR